MTENWGRQKLAVTIVAAVVSFILWWRIKVVKKREREKFALEK
jgi:hypothetical protein